jgi:hypothetical protein
MIMIMMIINFLYGLSKKLSISETIRHPMVGVLVNEMKACARK